MDERIANLLQERGHEDLLMTVNDVDLEDKLLVAMEKLRTDDAAIRDSIGRTVVRNLERMARMGVFLERHVQKIYPEFPVVGGVRNWEDYLPTLNPGLEKLVEQHGLQSQPVGVS
jgi:hypothetical protein